MKPVIERKIPLMIILSSPSGAGKTSIARELRAHHRNMAFSISATTRPPRPGEIDGVHYHFVSHEKFSEMVNNNEMLEHAEVFGHCYGTPRAPVAAALQAGDDVIFDVDWQGAEQLRACELKDYVISVFVLPPSIKELHQRLETRAQDSADVINNRMQKSRAEISHWNEFEYLVMNNDINQAVRDVSAILRAERLKRVRWKNAGEFVARLNGEFEEIWNR